MNKTIKQPWELYPEIWKTKSAFFTYLRGQLRQTWSRYPAKLKWKASQAIKPPASYTGRAKKLGQCEYCKEWFGISSLEVDHIEQSGKCNSWEESSEFLYKLLDCNYNWCLACKPCHKVKSLAEKNGMSFEEARIEKEVIAICKDTKGSIQWLKDRKIVPESNAKKRREQIKQQLHKENK